MTKEQQGREGDENGGQSKAQCVDCKTDLGTKSESIKCGFCKSLYCFKCSKLRQALFNEICKEESILWTCVHCRIAIPGVNMMMAQLSNLEKSLGKKKRKKLKGNRGS